MVSEKMKARVLVALAKIPGERFARDIGTAAGVSEVTATKALLQLCLEGKAAQSRLSRFTLYSLVKPAAKAAKAGGASG